MNPDVRATIWIVLGAGLALLGLSVIVGSGLLGPTFYSCGKGGGCAYVSARQLANGILILGFAELAGGVVLAFGIDQWYRAHPPKGAG